MGRARGPGDEGLEGSDERHTSSLPSLGNEAQVERNQALTVDPDFCGLVN